MLEANDLVNPTFNYLPRFNKPVLSYWIVAAFYRLFGVSVAVQRFAIALGALIIIGCAYALARAAVPDPGFGIQDSRSGIRDQGLGMSDSAALWAAAGLAAAPRLMMFARRIFIDIWITAFMSLTLVFFALSERYPERRRRFLALMYVAIGLGVLTKGPVAIALPGLAFALYLAVHRELRRITEMMIPLGILIIAVIVVPWYGVLYNEQGWTYIKSFLVSENIERFTSGVGVRQPRGPWFYLPVVLSDSFPWSMLLPLAAVAAWRRRTRVEALLWCWIVAIVGFFSLSAGKQDLYIFPIVAAVAALGGLAIQRGLADPRWRKGLAVTIVVTGALLTLVGAAVLYLFQTAGRVYALESALVVGAIGLAGGLVTAVLGLSRKPAAAALTLLAAVIAVNWIFVLRALPEFERYKPVPEMSALLRERLRPGDAVAHYRVALPSMVYYLRRHIETFESREAFLAFMRGRHAYAVLRADEFPDVAGELPPGACVVGEWDFFQAKLKDVLAHRPLPKLVLVDTQCPPR